jgi:hypothetical protein
MKGEVYHYEMMRGEMNFTELLFPAAPLDLLAFELNRLFGAAISDLSLSATLQ